MNLLAIIIIVLAIAAAGAIIYAAWELSSDKPAAGTQKSRGSPASDSAGDPEKRKPGP